MEAVSGEISDLGNFLSMKKNGSDFRGEIDTSAPFESVKEAVSRFGGLGFWKPLSTHHNNLNEPHQVQHDTGEIDIAKMEQQATELEKDLILKERETLNVLKDLESTKIIVDELKCKLQKGTFQVTSETDKDRNNTTSMLGDSDKENHENGLNSSNPSSTAPGLILTELKQAKVNLSRTTSDLADIRASVDQLNKKLDKERISLEKTRERLTLNSSKVLSLEDELNSIREKLHVAKDSETNNHLDISVELQRLCSEAEQFKKIGEEARSEVARAMSEIEQTKARIKASEIRLVAARKMKEAARASEAVALTEIKALSNSENSSDEVITLSHEEYSSLVCKARDAEKRSQLKVIGAMNQVDEANVSKMEMLKKAEEATFEVKTSKKALEVALNRVESANQGKLAVEEALRKWRSENGQKRRNSTRFKNPYTSQQRRESRLFDVNGLNLASDGSSSVPVLMPMLSIGQILSRKLLVPEEFETETKAGNGTLKRKVSLGQMLSKKNNGGDNMASSWKSERGSASKQISGKRKKFGFGGFSLRLMKQSKKKKPTLNLS